MTLAADIRRRLGPVAAMEDWPRVSIVVLSRDGAGRLRRLVRCLKERTDYPRLELILVDNASSDDTLELMRNVEVPFPISIVANAHNESFSDGCNQGAALASGDLLLFLNDDVEPLEPGWLRELVACLRSWGAAATGPTLVERSDAGEDSRVEQRGHWIGVNDGMLVPVYRDHGEDPLALLDRDAEVATLAAACLLVEREAFDRVGGFTHGFWYGGEDSDLSLKLREHGMAVVVSGRSLLVHEPNSTLREVDRHRRAAWVRGNRRLFMELWGARVRREYELDRLRGGGLWAKPGPAGASSWGATPAAVEALAFCFNSLGAHRPPWLEALAAALRARGRRAAVLCDGEAGGLAAFDYDVVVHLGGPWREAPKRSQLNLHWPDPKSEGTEPDRLAERLLDTAEELALERGLRRRVTPSSSETR